MQIQLVRPRSPGARDLTNNKIVKPAEKRISRGHCPFGRVLQTGLKVRPSSTKSPGYLPYHCRHFRPNRLSDEQQFRSTDTYRLMLVQSRFVRRLGNPVWPPCTLRFELRGLSTTIVQRSALLLRNES